MSGEHGCPFYQTFLSGVVVEQSSSDPKNMGSNHTESGAHFFSFLPPTNVCEWGSVFDFLFPDEQ